MIRHLRSEVENILVIHIHFETKLRQKRGVSATRLIRKWKKLGIHVHIDLLDTCSKQPTDLQNYTT